jgi:hydrogenase maturation protein HypF
VQGVGFRPFVFRLARELGLPGWVRNSSQGVFLEVEGPEAALREFLRRLEAEKPPVSSIQSLEAAFLDAAGFDHFEIRESSSGPKTALIMPDLATCPECRREINDPANRRYRYPFTNCTNCGPRFTIIESLPYDRQRTTMKKFVMCAECAREYHDPASRRFHAQPNACPACGPRLELWLPAGEACAEGDEALRAAAEAIRHGAIVAVKGLGGFQLLVDARNQDAVRELRRRKRREEKPFALMYPSLTAVLEHCQASEVELRLLQSPESPIVLLRRKSVAPDWAECIAPQNPYFGVMLPYTPLHHLLMQELGFPVVATSGNLSEEPICISEAEALARLAGIADRFLVHGRPILRHADDSIVREMAGRELVLRRARGFAPLPVLLGRELPPLLAVGPHQKNTIAISVGPQVFVSQHIGDLETAESMRAFTEVNRAFRALYDFQPQALACDLHPDYLSTHFARRAASPSCGAGESGGEPVIAVQHHYAHVLACMAENQLRPPVLGVAWDGSGYGLDGTLWGGEFLRITHRGFERAAHLRTFLLPGGERAAKEPRRAALGALYEIFGDAAFDLRNPATEAFTAEELRVLRLMLQKGLNSPRTSSAGRLFDAVAALLALRQRCAFEGQAAMELEFAADVSPRAARRARQQPGDGRRQRATPEAYYPFTVTEVPECAIVDWEPMLRAILASSPRAARRTSGVAAAFHNTMARMIAAVAGRVGEAKVVLSGGCFQNRYLTAMVIRHLQHAGFQAYWHQRIPPNDGGIALGQLLGAARELAAEE